MNEEPQSGREPFWVIAIDRWLAGLVFAVIISSVVVCAAYLPVLGQIFRAIEDAGVDAAMRARTVMAPNALIGQERSMPPGFVFIDIDSASCELNEPSFWCETRSPAAPAAAVQAAARALEMKPRVIIIDTPLWDIDQGLSRPNMNFKDLVTAAVRFPDTRIIAVAPFRPGPRPDTGFLEPSLIPAELADGHIKFAPAFTWNPGNVVRRYPGTIKARTGKGDWLQLASLPYLAGRYAASANDAGAPDGVECDVWPRPTFNPGDCPETAPGFDIAGEEEQNPLVFSLPSRARPGAGSGSDDKDSGLYDRYTPRQIFGDPKNFQRRAGLLSDKVVVIGTSAAIAMDWHDTPLGEMAGAEVILNVARSAAADATLNEPTIAGKLLREAGLASIGSIPFFGFWLLSLMAHDRLSVAAWGRRISWLPAILLFVPTIAVAGLFMLLITFLNLPTTFISGRHWDILTPLAALSLECFSDAAKLISGLLEHYVERYRRQIKLRLSN